MSVDFEFTEISFSLSHAYAMSFFDKRGVLVKKLKEKLPYVNTDTDKNERIIMSTQDKLSDHTIQGFFTPSKLGLRQLGKDDLNKYYSVVDFWSKSLIDGLGLDGYLDGVTFTITHKVDLSDNVSKSSFYEALGFPINADNDRNVIDFRFNQLYEKGQNIFTCSVLDDDINENIYELEFTYLIHNPKGVNKNLITSSFSVLFEEFNSFFPDNRGVLV
jgi:hypothetical protein